MVECLLEEQMVGGSIPSPSTINIVLINSTEMFYLNLTKGFTPFRTIHSGSIIDHEVFIFAGGEPHVKLKLPFAMIDEVRVTSRVRNMQEFMILILALDALKRNARVGKVHLFIPYFPGARQDRLMVPGEPLTVKVFADIINKFNLDSVSVFDAHSNATSLLLNNCKVYDNHSLVDWCLSSLGDKKSDSQFNLVSPDAGSNKKIKDLAISLAKNNWVFDVIKCDKTRDTSTGKLTGFEVYSEHLGSYPTIIVDDICDGGGTFIGLAEELKSKVAGDLYLIVSHGIFSKGFKELSKLFTRIFTTDSWTNSYSIEFPEIEKKSEIVEIVPFNKFKYIW